MDRMHRHSSETSSAGHRRDVFDPHTTRALEDVGHFRGLAVPVVESGDRRVVGLTAALVQRAGAGVVSTLKAFDPTFSSDPGEYRSWSAVDMARLCLESSGRSTREMGKMALVGAALQTRGQGSLDFTTLLENVLHKTLRASYAVARNTWPLFCVRSTNKDFRPSARYRLGSLSVLDAVNEHGEFKNKSIPDAEKAVIALATKGNIVSLTRQAIVNDDMGAFIQLMAMLGRAADRSVESGVYALLAQNSGLGPVMADGLPLFDSAHKNISTPAVLSVEGLDQDRVTMAQQTDSAGHDYLDIRPAVMLVPVALGGTARVIIASQYDPDTANKLQRGNKVFGLVSQDSIVDTPRLSGTRRYLFADPSIAPCLEVAFMEGDEAPVLEAKDGWRIDGVEFRARFDYGIGAVDHRGGVTNAGA